MELKAFYSVGDLLALVDQDLRSKGYRQAEGTRPDTNGHTDLTIALTIERWLDPIPAQLQAEVINDETPTPPQPVSARKTKGVSSVGKTPEQLEKDREYRQRHLERKAAAQQQEQEQAAQEELPREWQNDFADKVLAEIEELKREQKTEVVAASPGPFHLNGAASK
jgi:hypothetical protein